jgi:hypothetical protein
VARAKVAWRRRRRVFRPWVPKPGEHLVIDWGTEDGLQIFCAVLAWSRFRFVRFAPTSAAPHPSPARRVLRGGGRVPAVVLSDRMG